MNDTPPIEIATETDPTPLVLALAKLLRESAGHPELRAQFSELNGPVPVRAESGAQAATLTFGAGRVHVTHGVPPGTPAETPLHEALAKLLSPPVPPWREAARSFWTANCGTDGFPAGLRIVCTTEDAGDQELLLGDNPETYEIHGPAPALAEAFSGRGDSFQSAMAAGVTVVGGLGHLSALCGAHWRVKFGG